MFRVLDYRCWSLSWIQTASLNSIRTLLKSKFRRMKFVIYKNEIRDLEK